MLLLHIHLIPGQKLCRKCWDRIQEINEKEDSEEDNDQYNSDDTNNLERTFFKLSNTLEEMGINLVKLHAAPQHFHPAEGKQTLEKNQNVLEENNSKLKSCVADVFAINQENLSDDERFWH